MSVGSWFEEFCKNIKFDDKDLENLRYRYRQINKGRVNSIKI